MIHLANTRVIETDRLILRAPGQQDWPQALAFFQAPRSEFIRNRQPLDAGKSWRAFCHIIGSWVARGYGSFIITERGSDTALGLTGPWHPIDWPEREIGWTLWSDAAEGRGIAFEAARATLAHAFGPLGWDTAVSYIDPENARSIALAERLGAVLDPGAPHPEPDEPCLVYRHPHPGAQP